MPKAARYRLSWSDEHQTYELYETSVERPLSITPGEPEWFEWLDTVSSFTFSGKHIQFSARKESRRWGDRYWYAFHRVGSKVMKKYLGRTNDLTLARLEGIASLLADQEMDTSEEVAVQGSLKGKIQKQHRSKETKDVGVLEVSEGASLNPTTRQSFQQDQVLTIKLHRPRPHRSLVSRSRLVERIREGIERALILISAPAGFGKTMLLAQYISESDTTVAWLTLEPEDDNPARFLAYLIAALQTVDDHIGTNALELLYTQQPPPLESVLALLINDLMRFPKEDIVLMLDDYHVITVESIHRAMTYLLEHLPPQLHLVLATRADPPLPLSRLRARGQLVELRAAELRMNSTEAYMFLHTVMGLDLPPDAIAALESRTEGWIAGLQLAALSLQGRTEISAFLTAFTGSHRYVLDYLSDEVLSKQAPTVQTFLLHTSVLDRLSGPLCDAVVGRDGSQGILEALERENLFVVSLDDERQWYRYHNLFADFLKSRLQQFEPEVVIELHQRASSWYQQHALPVDAIQHALIANDSERVADLIERNYEAIALRGHVTIVLSWLNMLPDALVRTRPLLCLHHADLLMFANQIEACEMRLRDAERCLQDDTPEDERKAILGKIALMRALLARYPGDFERSVSIAYKALDLLPVSESFERASSMLSAAHVFLVDGDVTNARIQQLQTLLAPAYASSDLFMVLRSIILFGRLHIMQGQLKKAAATYEGTVRMIPEQEILRALSGGAAYYFGVGDVFRERNRLDVAEQYLMNGLDLVESHRVIFADDIAQGYIALARLLQAKSDFSGAISLLDEFAQLARERLFMPHLRARGSALQTQMELARNNFEAANNWLDTNDLNLEDELCYQREEEYLTLARVYISRGSEDSKGSYFPNALYLLNRLLADADAKARISSILEILILQSLALYYMGERTQALSKLARALKHAAPEGYIRIFVDEGAPMLALLREASKQGIFPEYVATLLATFGIPVDQVASNPASHLDMLIEPLTAREREVLQLLLEGASNREIARRLILSINTVKRHIYNICGKLGVQSRTQAIVKARTLNLL